MTPIVTPAFAGSFINWMPFVSCETAAFLSCFVGTTHICSVLGKELFVFRGEKILLWQTGDTALKSSMKNTEAIITN